MPTIGYESATLQTFGDYGHIIAWQTLSNGDNGAAVRMVGSPDRSIQVEGVFGVGGTVLIEGSNDGVNYRTLQDPGGNPLSLTSAQIVAILPITAYTRPRVSAGDGTTALVVTLLVRRQT